MDWSTKATARRPRPATRQALSRWRCKSDLNGGGFVVAIAANGVELTIAPASSANVTASVASTGAATNSAGTTSTLALTGPTNLGDTWTVTVDGHTFVHPVGASETPTTVAGALATLINNNASYTAFASNGTIYITALSGSVPALSLAVARSTSAPNATVSGAVSLTWTQDVALAPAGPEGFLDAETWTVFVGGSKQRHGHRLEPGRRARHSASGPRVHRLGRRP